jgi:hypothetical protein
MKHIQLMIDQHGGFEAVRTHYLRLENPPLMRLVIGGPYPNGAYEVSVAHYGEQNGDAMRDPEITFLVLPTDQGHTWSPLTFENSYLGAYQVVAGVTAEGTLQVRQPKQMQELRKFANQWDTNIKEQGFLEVFQRQYGAEKGATHAPTVTRPG